MANLLCPCNRNSDSPSWPERSFTLMGKERLLKRLFNSFLTHKKRHKIGKAISPMQKHESNKKLLDKFTLEQLHDMCKFYKREMNRLDYRDRIILGESNSNIIKKRFIAFIAGFFSEFEILEYASKHGIMTN